SANAAPDCVTQGGAIVSSAGYNFLGTSDGCGGWGAGDGDQIGTGAGQSPMLSPLADHGGKTATHAPFTGGPLVDKGHPGGGAAGRACEATDQIGTARPVGARCDVGAFEGSIAGPTGTGGASGAGMGGQAGAADA